jgi:surface antigen/uncharacterized protein YraI
MGRYYEWDTYRIVSEDSLSAIALRTMGSGTAPYYNFIAQKNGIANPNLIYAGQTILIPRRVAAPNPGGGGNNGAGTTAPINIPINGNSPNYRDGRVNPFAYRYQGQCTWFAYGRMLETGLLPAGAKQNGWFLGHAESWRRDATRAGLSMSSIPTPGARGLVVWPPGVRNSNTRYGHVAFLEEVYPDGRIRISESNWAGKGISERILTPAQYQGLSFIRLENATSNPQFSSAQGVPNQSREHRIQSGDTLWGIAQRFLGNGNRWREIMKTPAGGTFTDAEARQLRVGQSVYLPITQQIGTGQPVVASSLGIGMIQTQVVSSTTGYVNYGSGINFRTGPSTTSSIISGLANGTSLTILKSVSGGSYTANGKSYSTWYEVKVGNKTGYVAAAFISQGSSSGGQPGYVNYGPGINFRTGPSTTSSIISGLANGTSLTILKSVSGGSYTANGKSYSTWYEVKVGNKTGYVAAAFISQGSSGGGQYNRQAAVNYANQYWNSRNPSYHSYSQNCANFVSQCLVAGGLFPKYKTDPINGNYPYTTVAGLENKLLAENLAKQIVIGRLSDATVKNHISNTLRPGDVILYDWDDNGTWDHCDIYLGGGLIASNTTDRNGSIFNLRAPSTKVKLLQINR